jgi:hypothetical protein
MLGANMAMGKALGFLGGVSQNSFAFIAERQIDRCRDLFANRGVSLNLLPDGFDLGMRT